MITESMVRGNPKEAADIIATLEQEVAALEAREAALVKADDARTEIVKAAHLMFVYCQKMSAKIKAHRLEQIMPSPDAEIQAFIKAVAVSREARSLISAQEGK